MPDLLDRLRTAVADRYRVDREIGRGGMAHVFLAQDLKLDRPVALKVLRPDLAAVLGGERFLREISLAAKLEHPHILGIYDSGEADGILYYVMPYVEGESLRDRLTREKQLPVDEALQISREVADALSYAHARGVIHRDIKPENILLRAGHAVVADFGIARAIDAAGGDRLTETGVALGTPAYMSPEQAGGSRDLDGRSDLYSLGCVLYEMLAGQPPFTGPTIESVIAQHLTAPAPDVTMIRPSVPSWVVAALQRSLAKTPADRFNPVALFAEAIAPRASVAEPAPSPTPRETSPARWLVMAAVAVVIAVGGWFTWQALRSGETAREPRGPRPFTIVAEATGSAEGEIRAAVQALVMLGLDQAGAFAPLPEEQVRRGLALAGKPDSAALTASLARELAVRGGLQTVVVPSVQRVGQQLVLGLRVMDADSAVVLAVAEARAADEDDLMDATDRVLRTLQDQLEGRESSLGTTRPLRQIATPSFEAFTKYQLARTLLRTGAGDRYEAAGALLHEALALDSAFAAAWDRIGIIFYNRGYVDSASIAFERALASSHRLTETQRYHIEAQLLMTRRRREGEEVGARASVVAIYDRIIRLDPNDSRAYYNRANELAWLRRFDDAAESRTRSLALNPFPSAEGLRTGVTTLIAAGRLREARTVLDRLQDPRRWHQYGELQLALAEHAWARAESLATSYLADPRSVPWVPGRSALTLASVHAARGAVARADSVLRTDYELRGGEYARGRALLALASGMAVPPEHAAVHDEEESALGWEVVRAAVAGEPEAAAAAWRELRSRPDTLSLAAGRQVRASQLRASEAVIAGQEGRWDNVAAIAREELAKDLGAEMDHLFRWLGASAYEILGKADSAAQLYEMVTSCTGFEVEYEIWSCGVTYSFAHFRLGKLYTELEQYDRAEEHYLTFLDTFTQPDPEYELMVKEARAKLEELARGR